MPSSRVPSAKVLGRLRCPSRPAGLGLSLALQSHISQERTDQVRSPASPYASCSRPYGPVRLSEPSSTAQLQATLKDKCTAEWVLTLKSCVASSMLAHARRSLSKHRCGNFRGARCRSDAEPGLQAENQQHQLRDRTARRAVFSQLAELLLSRHLEGLPHSSPSLSSSESETRTPPTRWRLPLRTPPVSSRGSRSSPTASAATTLTTTVAPWPCMTC